MTNIIKKYKIILILIAIIAIGLTIWYQNRLSNAKTERDNIVSRIIKNPDFNNSQVDKKVLKTGSFSSLDPVHYASGKVSIVESLNGKYLELSDDFVTNPDGPDLYIWLVRKQAIGGAINGVDIRADTYIEVSPLETKAGKQIYQLNNLDITDKDYAVVIWCKAFGVQFSNAVLNDIK